MDILLAFIEYLRGGEMGGLKLRSEGTVIGRAFWLGIFGLGYIVTQVALACIGGAWKSISYSPW